MQRVSLEVLREFPDVQRHFDAMSYDEAFRTGGDLAQRGLPRLEDQALLAHMRHRHRMLSSSEPACVALVGGDSHAAIRVLEAQPSEELRAHLRITTRAQQLELRGGPRPMSTEDAAQLLTEALERVRAALPPDEAARWDRVRVDDVGELCFLERTAMRELLRMPAAEGARYQRAILESALSAL